MCGFVCLWEAGDETLAGRTIEKIAHRGPDALEVVRLEGALVVAHCRLSIIGLQAGAQSIHQGRDLLVANRDIYNHADLRAIRGESAFETASDSETIVHLFRAGALRWINRLVLPGWFELASSARESWRSAGAAAERPHTTSPTDTPGGEIARGGCFAL